MSLIINSIGMPVSKLDTIVSNYRDMRRNVWIEYVLQHQYGTIFHTPQIIDAYDATPNHEPFGLFVINSENKITALLIGYIQIVKNGVLNRLTRRAVLMNAPIFDTISDLEFLLGHYKHYAKKRAIYTEIRNHYELGIGLRTYENSGFKYEEHLNIINDVSLDTTSLFNLLSSSRKREVKFAYKEGLRFDILSTGEIALAYDIVREVYFRANLPLINIDFFIALINQNEETKNIIGFGVYHDNTLIGAMFTLSYKDTLYALYGGSYQKYFRKRPNDLLYWEVIKWASINGYKRLDFMGAGKPNVAYGVRNYKLQFGGSLTNWGRLYYYHKPILYFIARNGFKLIRKLVKIN